MTEKIRITIAATTIRWIPGASLQIALGQEYHPPKSPPSPKERPARLGLFGNELRHKAVSEKLNLNPKL